MKVKYPTFESVTDMSAHEKLQLAALAATPVHNVDDYLGVVRQMNVLLGRGKYVWNDEIGDYDAPGRPDVACGKNYSQNDMLILVKSAMKAAGLFSKVKVNRSFLCIEVVSAPGERRSKIVSVLRKIDMVVWNTRFIVDGEPVCYDDGDRLINEYVCSYFGPQYLLWITGDVVDGADVGLHYARLGKAKVQSEVDDFFDVEMA